MAFIRAENYPFAQAIPVLRSGILPREKVREIIPAELRAMAQEKGVAYLGKDPQGKGVQLFFKNGRYVIAVGR